MPLIDIPVDICLRIQNEVSGLLESSGDLPGLSFLQERIDQTLSLSGSPAPIPSASSKKRTTSSSMDMTADISRLHKVVRVNAPASSRNDTRKRGAAAQAFEEEESSGVDEGVQEEEESGDTSDFGSESSEGSQGESEVENRLERTTERVREKKKAWETMDGVRNLTEKSLALLQTLASIAESDNVRLLSELKTRLLSVTTGATHPTSLDSIITRCMSLEGKVLEHTFLEGVYLMELAIWLDHYKTLNNPTDTKIVANRCVIKEKTLRNMCGYGMRLLYLCLSGSPYILVLLALFRERWNVCKDLQVKDISALATYLREVPDNGPGNLIKNIIIPFCQKMKCDFRFPGCSITLPIGLPLEFWDTERFDQVVGDVEFHFFQPHERSIAWNSMLPDHLLPSLSYDGNSFLPDGTVILTYPRTFNFKNSKCPVSPSTTGPWTEKEHTKAMAAPEMKTLEDLTREIEGTPMPRASQPYIKFDTNILQGQTLKLQDKKKNLGALLITHMPDAIPQFWKHFTARIQTLYGSEFRPDKSERPGYDFLAIHYHWYNRYAEKGGDAPSDTHADQVKKAGSSRVNITQRTPHESKEIAENDAEYAIIQGIVEDIMDFIRPNMQYQLRDIYDDLQIYCNILPFNSQSPAHPFAGFVINICVSTNGHRDYIDKKICVVVPFGEWEGGEICLYELGLVIKLKPGDVLIFPSCHITHFNLHFSGLRGSLVLHSDRQGDNWVKDRNGWVKHMVKKM